MLPRNCDQCHHLFVPQSTGLRAIFCKTCYVRCEEAYLEIRRFLQDHPKASAAKIAVETNIPTAFIYHLFKSGRFVTNIPMLGQEDKRGLCTQCGKLLSVYFDALCDACDEANLKQTHTPDEKPVNGVASSFAPSRSSTSRRRRERSQYGFNRFR